MQAGSLSGCEPSEASPLDWILPALESKNEATGERGCEGLLGLGTALMTPFGDFCVFQKLR